MSFRASSSTNDTKWFYLEREYHEDAVEKLNTLKSTSATGFIATRSDMQCFIILSFRIGMIAKLGLNQGFPDPF